MMRITKGWLTKNNACEAESADAAYAPRVAAVVSRKIIEKGIELLRKGAKQ